MIPDQLQNIPKPKGFYTAFKQWPITPLSSNMFWQADDIARFLVNIKQGVMDPYRSHIQITIQVNDQIQPIGGLQIDNSAQSFIAQSVVSSNQVQIERITEYDTLACLLTDLGFSQYVCQSRDVQGLGYSNIQSHKPWTSKSSNGGMTSQVFYQGKGGAFPTITNGNPGLVFPTAAPWRTGYGNSAFFQNQDSQLTTPWQFWGDGAVASPTNPIWNGGVARQTSDQLSPGVAQIQQRVGRLQNVRFQVQDRVLKRDYPDVNTSKVQTAPIIKNQSWDFSTIQTKGFDPKRPYNVQFPQNITIMSNNHQTLNPVFMQNCCGLLGYQKPICPQFCRGTGQTMLSATIPQVQMQNGLILRNKVPLTQKTFRLPLISAICGILIPPQQFTLIPLQALYNTLIQLTFSKYAMFTTGYSDIHQLDKIGMANMQQRKWLISLIQWNMHIYTFGDQQVQQYIKSTLSKGLNITATGYSLVSQFQLPNGQLVRNSWPIGCQYQDLCQIYCVFLPNDYQTKTFCRKQFRLSNNITSLQIKLDTNFYPSQPIVGNAGNPQSIDSTGDNWPYYQLLLLSSNRLFSVNHPNPKINQKNFAINQRCYNVNNTDTFYTQNMYDNNNAWNFGIGSVNNDTALGMCNFHQNRYVGKAIFVYTWQPYGHSNQYLSGINTSGVRNFQITFNTSPINPFPRDQTLMIFARYNQLVSYTSNGISTYGK